MPSCIAKLGGKKKSGQGKIVKMNRGLLTRVGYCHAQDEILCSVETKHSASCGKRPTDNTFKTVIKLTF